jgi:alkylhydroperoxidase family enzyme
MAGKDTDSAKGAIITACVRARQERDMRSDFNGAASFDVVAREAQVVGQCQRIAPLSLHDISDDAKQLLLDLGKAFGGDIPTARNAQITGEPQADSVTLAAAHIPPTIATMLRHPQLYRRQVELGIQVAASEIPPRQRELAILRVAWLCRAPYQWGEHVELAKLCGVSTEEVERVTQGSSEEGWSDDDRAILCAVEELLGDQSMSDDTWNRLARTWDETQLMELPVLVGTYYTFALQQNAMKVGLPAYNKGLHQR